MPNYDESLPLDDAIRRVFPRADPKGIRQLLERAPRPDGNPQPARVLLAAVLLSAGDLDQLQHYLREAALDFRDVLYWAFYYDDEPPAHMRDFLRADLR